MRELISNDEDTCILAGTTAQSADVDAAEETDTAGGAQHEWSATAMEAAVREADAMLTSAPAAADLATSPPLKGAAPEPASGGNSKTSAGTAKLAAPTEVVASQAADPSNASAYAATAVAPQQSVLEPVADPAPDADATRLTEDAVPPAADDAARRKHGIMGTVSRLKAIFEKQRTDRQVAMRGSLVKFQCLALSQSIEPLHQMSALPNVFEEQSFGLSKL